MIIEKYYCDRCGIEVKLNKLLALSILLSSVFNAPDLFTGDLCRSCSKEFRRWYKLKKVKEANRK